MTQLIKMKELINKKMKTHSNIKNALVSTIAMILLTLGSTFQLSAQCAGVTMTCNDVVQVTLDHFCEFEVTPDVMLENPSFPASDYEVTVKDASGNVIPGSPVISGFYKDSTLTVEIRLIPCNLVCWGEVDVEDKLAPITTCTDVVIDCDDNTSPGSVGGFTVTDACSSVGDIETFWEDVLSPLTCSGLYGRTITRTWTAVDESGNTSTCVQQIFITRTTIADVTCPANLEIDCDDPIARNSNFPDPSVTGAPTNTACENILFYYTDSEIPLCGAGLKIVRSWYIVDWCTGEELNCVQIIKVEDKAPPIISCPVDFGAPTGLGYTVTSVIAADINCLGTWVDVTAPNVINECSDFIWSVAYKVADANGGAPPMNTPYITDNVVVTGFNGNQPIYNITDLPIGQTWIKYTVEDDCGFQTDCFTEVIVYDPLPPTAICEGSTVVSLVNSDCQRIFANSIDDNSWDNCSDNLTFKISWDGVNYFESLEICCDRVGDNLVYLMVTDPEAQALIDDFGLDVDIINTGVCTANIHVDDKVAPTISCPSDRTIGCDDSQLPSNTGTAIGEDNCNSTDIDYSDSGFSSTGCNTGFFIRTWTVEDNSGNTVSCTQKITVISDDPLLESDINWPTEIITVNGCSSAETDPYVIGSFPTVDNDSECVDYAVTYDDDEFYNMNGNCLVINRTWKVTDWCMYMPNTPIQFFEYEQTINITGGAAPVFSGCDDITVSDDNNDCQADVNLNHSATDDCSPSLSYNWTVDFYCDGSIDDSGNGTQIAETYPSGRHLVTYFATDDCGNVGECSFKLTITDDKAPTPICFAEVVWVLDQNGEAEVWASDFDIKSEDTCSPQDQLIFSFNAAGTQPALMFDCDDIPNGIGVEIPLQMYVIDQDGNSEFCLVILVLQDNSDVCQDIGAVEARVAGTVMSESGEEVVDVEVELMNVTDNVSVMNMTDVAGDYIFNPLDYYDGYSIDPKKTTDPMNGVSTLDLVLIQKHILNMQMITSPYKLIAADINKSQNISATDLIELRKLILGIYDEFPNNDPYLFVPTDYTFVDPLTPWGYEETIDISALYVDEDEADFIAIKVGDVNDNATYNVSGNTIENRSGETYNMIVNDRAFKTGETVDVVFTAEEAMDLMGMQFTLNIENGLSLINASSSSIEVKSTNFNVAGNRIMMSWDDINAPTVEGEVFTLSFLASEDGYISEVLTLSSDVTSSEAYNSDAHILDLGIEFRGAVTDEDFALYQNTPNPFSANTAIRFNMSEASDYTLDIMDVTGKIIMTSSAFAERGITTINITKSDLPSTGVYYYQLSAAGKVAVKKMIVMN